MKTLLACAINCFQEGCKIKEKKHEKEEVVVQYTPHNTCLDEVAGH